MTDARERCDREYHWCQRCYWSRASACVEGDPPNVKDELRKLFTAILWLWSIRLKCWAWNLDQQETARLDSELEKS